MNKSRTKKTAWSLAEICIKCDHILGWAENGSPDNIYWISRSKSRHHGVCPKCGHTSPNNDCETLDVSFRQIIIQEKGFWGWRTASQNIEFKKPNQPIPTVKKKEPSVIYHDITNRTAGQDYISDMY
jgi:hypothetical protein